jgi:hypothetical protein
MSQDLNSMDQESADPDDADHTPTAFHYVTHWPQGTPKDGAAALEFWRRENAIGDEAHAQQRLREIVLHACNEAGEVAGICTAVPLTLPRLGQPMYYYRCFIGSHWRSSRLVFDMLNHAFGTLQDYAREQDFPCIGVVLELENARFGKALRAPVWPKTGFTFIGKSQRNFDLRVRYFRGARLKPSTK